MKYGIPNVIHTDNGKAFCNRIVNELLNRCGVKHSTSTPYHSMGNAVAERCQQVILNMLGTLKPAKKQKWHNHCDYISYAYNTSVHVSTGLTPYFLMFGRHPRLIGDAILDLSFEQPSHKTASNFMGNLQKAYKICEQKLKEKQLKYKQFYDAKLSKDIVNLKVDDIALVKNQVMSNKIDNGVLVLILLFLSLMMIFQHIKLEKLRVILLKLNIVISCYLYIEPKMLYEVERRS